MAYQVGDLFVALAGRLDDRAFKQLDAAVAGVPREVTTQLKVEDADALAKIQFLKLKAAEWEHTHATATVKVEKEQAERALKVIHGELDALERHRFGQSLKREMSTATSETEKAVSETKKLRMEFDKLDQKKGDLRLLAPIFGSIASAMRDAGGEGSRLERALAGSSGNSGVAGALGVVKDKATKAIGEMSLLAKLTPALLPAGLGLAGGASALIGSLGAGAAGAGALGIGAAGIGAVGGASLLSVIKPVSTDLKAATTAWDAYELAVQRSGAGSKQAQKAMIDLNIATKGQSPLILQLVKTTDEFGKHWRSATKQGQSAIAGLANDVIGLANRHLPFLAGIVNRVTVSMRQDLKPIEDTIFGHRGLEQLKSLGNTFDRVLGPALRGVSSLMKAFLNIAVAVEPYLIRGADHFAKWADKIAIATGHTDHLNGVVKRLVSQFDSWMHLLEALGRLMVAFFGAGAAQGQGMVDKLTAILNKWTAWIKADPAPIHKFFKDSIRATEALFATFGSIASVLGQIGNALMPALAAILESLAPTIKVVAKAFGDIADFVAKIISHNSVLKDLLAGMVILAAAWKAWDFTKQILGLDRLILKWREVTAEATVATAAETRASVVGSAPIVGGGPVVAGGGSSGLLGKLSGRGGLTGKLAGGVQGLAKNLPGALGVGIVGSLATSALGSAVGGSAGSTISSVGNLGSIGAAIGTAIEPGIGTAIGAGAGILVGGISKGLDALFGGDDPAKWGKKVGHQLAKGLGPEIQNELDKLAVAAKKSGTQDAFNQLGQKSVEAYLKALQGKPGQYLDQGNVFNKIMFELEHKVPPRARAAGAQAALQWTLSMQDEHKLPPGSYQAIFNNVLKRVPEFRKAMAAAGITSASSFALAFGDPQINARLAKATHDHLLAVQNAARDAGNKLTAALKADPHFGRQFSDIIAKDKDNIPKVMADITALLIREQKTSDGKRSAAATADAKKFAAMYGTYGALATQAWAAAVAPMTTIIHGIHDDIQKTTGKGFSWLISNTGKMLSAFGIKLPGISIDTPQHFASSVGTITGLARGAFNLLTGSGGPAAAPDRNPAGTAGLATGGRLFNTGVHRVPGPVGPDSVPLFHPDGDIRGIVAPGELLIANRHTEHKADMATMAYYGKTLGQMAEEEHTPHDAPMLFAKGGRVPRYATGGRGGANLNGHPGNISSGLRSLIGTVEGQFPGLVVTATTDGTHVANSFHYKGEAVDLAGGANEMNSAASWVKTSGLYRQLAEGIHNPNLAVKWGKIFSGAGPFGAVWGNHTNHIHLAITGGGVSGSFPAVTEIPVPRVRGEGAAGALVQAVMRAATGAANKKLAAAAGAAGGGDIFPGGSAPNVKGRYSKRQLMQLWTAVGGNPVDANIAAAVALAESAGDPNNTNHNTNGTTDRGLWQINSIWGRQSTYDPTANARAAVSISHGGSNWHPWSTFNSGRYRQFLAKGGRIPSFSRSGTSKAKKPPTIRPAVGHKHHGARISKPPPLSRYIRKLTGLDLSSIPRDSSTITTLENRYQTQQGIYNQFDDLTGSLTGTLPVGHLNVLADLEIGEWNLYKKEYGLLPPAITAIQKLVDRDQGKVDKLDKEIKHDEDSIGNIGDEIFKAEHSQQVRRHRWSAAALARADNIASLHAGAIAASQDVADQLLALHKRYNQLRQNNVYGRNQHALSGLQVQIDALKNKHTAATRALTAANQQRAAASRKLAKEHFDEAWAYQVKRYHLTLRIRRLHKTIKELREELKKIKPRLKDENTALSQLKKWFYGEDGSTSLVDTMDTLAERMIADHHEGASDIEPYMGELAAFIRQDKRLPDGTVIPGYDIPDSALAAFDPKAAQAALDASGAGGGGGDAGGGSSGTPSAADIAAAVLAEFQNFQSSRASLFSQFGSNFVPTGVGAFQGAGLAAGTQFYGAAAGPYSGVGPNPYGGPDVVSGGVSGGSATPASSGGKGDTNINITQHFAGGPSDPMSYAAGLKFELAGKGI